jgi:release factor glutamine methyltransferase
VSGSATIAAALAQAGLAPVDARVLLGHVLGRNRAWLAAHGDDPLAPDNAAAFAALARRRRDGEPVAYLTGTREFWGLSLVVSPAVLIPRPETEVVVEAALARLPRDAATRVLDLGTGSGAIALAIAHERPRAQVLATDASPAALAVARGNASLLALANVELVESDWYANVPQPWRGGAFDLIASNPPYVAAGDPHLAEGDLRYEPPAALSPGGDGLDALRIIVAGAPARLAPGGTLVVEHGYDQGEAVQALFGAAGLIDVVAIRDLAGTPRAVAGRTPGA